MLVDRLNRAFLEGAAADDVTRAGVFMRAFDQLEDGERPWLPCSENKCATGYTPSADQTVTCAADAAQGADTDGSAVSCTEVHCAAFDFNTVAGVEAGSEDAKARR